MSILILLVIVLLAGAGVVLIVLESRGANPLAVTVRLGRYGLANTAPSERNVDDLFAARSRSGSAVAQSMERLVGRGRFAHFIVSRLDRADLKMTAGEFVSICVAVFVVGLLVGLIIKGTVGFFAGGLVGLVAPWIYLRRRINKRRKHFLEQLADMAQMMGNSMRAGFSIIQSMDLVGQEGPPPASQEFERVVTEIKLGLPVDTALEHLLQRMPSEDLGLLIVAINVQRQIGGNLSEILMVISQTIRSRVRFERDLRALTAQARYSSYIITALPIAVAVVINFMDREYESYLYTSTTGNIMIAASIVMLSMGFFFLNRIANIEV